jgi:hypothetical protein
VKIARGGAATLAFRVRNAGASPVDLGKFSLQLRLDISAKRLTGEAMPLRAGEVREFRYEVRAPERINLTSDSNRVAYGHFSGVSRRGSRAFVSHLPFDIEITD